MRIIVKAIIVAEILHELDMDVDHAGRDNVGGVVISGDVPDWTEENAERLAKGLISLSDLVMACDEPELELLTEEDILRLVR
jgi:hypothetical protein